MSDTSVYYSYLSSGSEIVVISAIRTRNHRTEEVFFEADNGRTYTLANAMRWYATADEAEAAGRERLEASR